MTNKPVHICNQNGQLKAIWALLVVIMSILAFFFSCLASIQGQVSDYKDTQSKVDSRLSAIETNISWIRSYMEKNGISSIFPDTYTISNK